MRCSADDTVLSRIAQKCGQTRDEHFDLNQRWGLKLGLALVLTLGVGLLTAAPASAVEFFCTDNDGDDYVVCEGLCTELVAGAEGRQCGECNDDNAAINPGATERCDDAIDSDCDGNNNNGYPNLGQNCALCDDGVGNDCGGDAFCISTGPGENCGTFTGDLCLTASLTADGNGVVCGPDGLSEICEPPDEASIAIWAQEGLGAGNSGNISEPTCFDGVDNDCDGTDLIPSEDLSDSGCWAPEICDGLDNDGDGLVDEDFPLIDPGEVGNLCSVGTGVCERSSTWACNEAGDDAVCGATAGAPKNEGTLFGNSCDDGKDNNCDGFTDLADSACAGFGAPELCGNSIDDDGDGVTDEGFPQIGQACSAGVGACRDIGELVCNSEAPVPGIGDGVACDVIPLDAPEPGIELSCEDFIDNDCDGKTDGDDPDCGPALADLGVTCSLPCDLAKPGDDCTGKHRITFGAANGVTLKADLLALDTDGSLLGIIEGVNDGDDAHLTSRLDPADWQIVSKTNKKRTSHTVFYPMPLLKVTGTKGGLEDVAYCSILPYHEVTDPDGLTIALSETNTLKVSGFLPLVDVDSLSISLDGIDILDEAGIDPTTFPTTVCTAPGDCVVQVAAGCGAGGLVDVEISNLIVEGLDTGIVDTARVGVGKSGQVNTYSFEVSGLPPGGHIFYIAGMPLPLPPLLDEQCLQDDLADTGTASAFGIQILSPFDQQVVASAPVYVEGTACGGNEIVDLKIQGNDLDVTVPTFQTCTTGNGTTVADECYVDFAEPIGETNLVSAAAGTADDGGTFHAGSNRIIADATDDEGNRTFNTDVVFGLGELQPPGLALTAEEESFRVAGLKVGAAVANEVIDLQEALASEIDPAFVVGLEESAVQDFFNEKCEGALDQFAAKAAANLNNKTFATVSLTPSCSCDLNNVPIVLESVTFTPSTADPTCAVDFRTDEIGVTIHLPDIRVQVGAHRSCTTRGLFGECVARTKLNITAVSQILNPAFEFVITETQIETKAAPEEDTQVFTWIIADGDGDPLFNPGLCDGGTQDGESCITDGQCPGAAKPEGLACVGETKNSDPPYNPVTQNDSGIECYGASICNVFAGIGGVLIEIFTLGFADGFEIVGIIDFDFEFKEDFLAEVNGTEPDPLELDEIEIDEEEVASFDQGKFTAGAIDVEIEPGGLKIEFPATFESQYVDPTGEATPGAVVTPAVGPTITNLIAAGDEISIGMADDVFNQLFASMKDAGTLEAFCTDGDGLTVDSLLPAIVDGGCDSLGAADGEVTVGDATVQGICHAIRGADCSALTADTAGLTNAKVGACTGFSGGDCTTLTFGQKLVCNAVPAKDIESTDSVLFCARQDMEPRLLFKDNPATDNSVLTDLLLNDLNVVLAIDKANDGYTGELEALQGCFGEEGDAAPDCLLYATCLDLTLKTEMGIDNSTCAPNQTGFIFGLLDVIPSGVQPGVMCSAATTAADNDVIAETAGSTTIDAVAESAEAFTPPFCAEGLTLGGILDFTSEDAKIFTITTDEATEGFADFLFLTGSLGPPNP